MKISPTIKVFRFPKSRAEITDVQLSLVVYSFSFVPPEVFMSVCVYKFMFCGEFYIYESIESS